MRLLLQNLGLRPEDYGLPPEQAQPALAIEDD